MKEMGYANDLKYDRCPKSNWFVDISNVSIRGFNADRFKRETT
jgi:hypothetical protein